MDLILIFFLFLFSMSNVFIIGKGSNAMVSLPSDKGIKLTIAEERDKRLAQKARVTGH
jgi:small subunit ribosomal protein S4e